MAMLLFAFCYEQDGEQQLLRTPQLGLSLGGWALYPEVTLRCRGTAGHIIGLIGAARSKYPSGPLLRWVQNAGAASMSLFHIPRGLHDAVSCGRVAFT